MPAIPETMQAWQYSKLGGGADALQLVEVPVPQPKPAEVLVRVQASAINAPDCIIQAGKLRLVFLPPRLPFIPGVDAAGEVVAVGSKVEAFKVGDQVFGTAEPFAAGALAEYAVLPAGCCALRPASVPPAQAACLGVAGYTALQALRDFCGIPAAALSGEGQANAERQPGNILIANSSGGIGHYAVQLAKLAGWHVTATCGQRNMETVKSLGADAVLDYASTEGAALASPEGRKYDIILDGTSGGLSWGVIAAALSPSGQWVNYTWNAGFFGTLFLNRVTFSKKKAVCVLSVASGKDAAVLAKLAGEGRVKAVLDGDYSFAEAKEAFRKCSEGHAMGKVVVVMDKQ